MPPDLTPPRVPDVDRYAALARQGTTLVAILNLIAAATLSGFFAASIWYPWSTPAYKLLTLTPGLFATLLAVLIGPRLWRRLVADGQGFSAAKGAVAGVLTVLLVQFITVEVFLTATLGLLYLSEPNYTHFTEFPNLILTAPLQSLPPIGIFTLPAGAAIGLTVAVLCQRKLNATRH